MKAWIIYFTEGALYNQNYINFYIEEGKKLDVDVKLILVEELDFGVWQNEWFLRYRGEIVDYPDFVICRAIYPLLSKQLEYMGIKVFNSSFLSEICNDKAKTYQYLAKTGIPMVNSNFCLNSQLEDRLNNLQELSVIKAVDGHGGSQVFLYDPSKSVAIDRIMKGIGKSDVVIQPYIEGRKQDLRVYVIGDVIVAAVLRTAREGFKANYSLGSEVRLYDLKEEEKQLVHSIIDQFDIGLVGIDFLIGAEGDLLFNEIEDVVGARMLYQCSDINLVNLYLRHIIASL
ncbi:ATP-grasp domain-containing protein [Mobilitalea sibirica]|uniref:ATP-grasp domain-containing protein n=1 Tax=Mobilitalea sibirica TaxID=1462919 RepID=A0A8J7HDM8_9FIRM|nr:ATP-grasp domain-containing protein [Mobilitalea sibirica]MBH1942277.1 ATP-grasp domain-containing protein [Mobilitalea sibirica]